MIAPIVYILCAGMCALCAGLLLLSFRKNRNRLLLWSGLGFCAFTLSNVLVFVDLVLLPQVDLMPARDAVTLVGVCILLFGLIWES
jgi:hypothetical protein